MSDPKQQSRRDFEKKIIMKAWEDKTYLEKLRKDPKGVIQEELKTIDPDFKLPDHMNVKVHEEDQNTLHLVVPANPRKSAQVALSDQAVDDVAAGSVVVAVVLAVAVNTNMAVNVQGALNVNMAANVNGAANVNAAANVNTAVTSTTVS